jgi:hypothetical protein
MREDPDMTRSTRIGAVSAGIGGLAAAMALRRTGPDDAAPPFPASAAAAPLAVG